MRKFLSVFLAIVFTFGSFTSVMASPKNMDPNLNLLDNTSVIQKFVADAELKGLKADDNIRINVELQEVPLIEYANKMKVKVNKLDKAVMKEA